MTSTSIGQLPPNQPPIQSEGRDGACKEIGVACKTILKKTYQLARYIFCCKDEQSTTASQLTETEIRIQRLDNRAKTSQAHQITRDVVQSGGNVLKSLTQSGLDIAGSVVDCSVPVITDHILGNIPIINRCSGPLASAVKNYAHNTSKSLKDGIDESVDNSVARTTETSFDAYDQSGKIGNAIVGIFKRK